MISVETIASREKDESGESYVECSECLETVTCEVKTANGSPQNLALIGHWDASIATFQNWLKELWFN